MVKVEKVEKTRKTKAKAKEEKPKASGSKPTVRRRAAQKSTPIVVEDSGEEGERPMEVDVESDVAPQPKRIRAAKGEFPTDST